MTKAHIAKKYANLLLDVQNNSYYKVDLTNRVNCYVCRCGHITKVQDIAAGVTPMFLNCEKCNQTASSTGYRDVAPDQKPTKEWYRPELAEVLKLKAEMLDHVLSGGLMIRKIAEK